MVVRDVLLLVIVLFGRLGCQVDFPLEDRYLVEQLEVDPVFLIDVDPGQVIGCWILDARDVGQDDVELKCLITVVPQLGWYPL